MHVAVEEVIYNDLLEESTGGVLRQLGHVYASGEHGLPITGGDGVVQVVAGHDVAAAVAPVHFRHDQEAVRLGMFSHGLAVGCLQPEVAFRAQVEANCEWISATARAPIRGQMKELASSSKVTRSRSTRRRILGRSTFTATCCPSANSALCTLCQRGGGYGLFVKDRIDLFQRAVEVFLYARANLLHRHGGAGILQPAEVSSHPLADQVWARREELAKLDEHCPERSSA